ncbi:MAG: T9SS type A sorting domain-containing protein [Williamsia sp.]|nr:T9SS type A sorting domain-containing protein [Williamsia sp.]
MKLPYFMQASVLSFLTVVLVHNPAASQCAAGQSSHSISYDTAVLGGGNDVYGFNFPQFDPTLGTLVKVSIETAITVKYNYQLENTDANPILYRVRVNRSDEIYCSALLAPLGTTQVKTLNSHLLQPYDGINGAGNDYVSVGPVYAFKEYPINYNITDEVAGFLGIGTVDFTYNSITDSYPSGSSHYLYSTNATDSISFKLTYYYCAVSFLPADIRDFTASRQSTGTIHLSWYTPNDVTGEVYEIQKSLDGRNFVSFQSVISEHSGGTSYQVDYQPQEADGNKLFFRVKQTEQGGGVKYTAVKTVVLPGKPALSMKVYPTVAADWISVYFANGGKGDWSIRIVSMTGKMMKQVELSNSDYTRIGVAGQLPSGVYIVQAENKRTHAVQLGRFMIQ